MKRYWDLTIQERANLTEEEVDRYCKIELMVRGIKRPIIPKEPKVIDPKLPLSTFYRVGNIIFEKKEDAYACLNLNPATQDCLFGTGIIEFAKPITDDVRVTELHRMEDVEHNRITLISNAKRMNEFRLNKHNYDHKIREIDGQIKHVRDDYQFCRAAQENLNNVLITYSEYLTLTDGDRKLAVDYLGKVYSTDEIEAAQEWSGVDFLFGVDQAEKAAGQKETKVERTERFG